MEWFKEKLWQLEDFREAFPSVFWGINILIILMFASMVFYFPVLSKIASFELLNVKPFYPLIVDNIDALKWGVFIVPILVGLIGWTFIGELYQRKLNRFRRY
ncbi:hypothetical protein NVT87_15270 [Acinetobacter radioresistens]|uniref:hypothetical protein n=1 Tax=Acinetobacter radioresistens TaxID=40216 RepID=UPI0022480719|nr:hypothetical protein [Acinetobacter radioresistens]MCX0332227.1 hypothetical protein [Acinetobacter radioresistens]